MTPSPTAALRGPLAWTEADADGRVALRHESDGVLVFEHGRVAARGPAEALLADPVWGPRLRTPGLLRRLPAGQVVVPGFVDCHLHLPQMRVIGAWGRQLLDWLNDYTFPAEARFADLSVCEAEAALFVSALACHGVTTASVFATVHPASAEALFAAAEPLGLQILSGKVLMDRHCPENLRDTAQEGYDQSLELLRRWHGRGRARYSVTPRFAPTSSPAQLEAARALWAAAPGVHLQSHLSENLDEIAWVRELFPEARSYTDAYARHGLLGPRAVYAHGVHLDDADRRQLADAGAAIAHCPTSNLFLGSGLFDLRAARAAGLPVGLGCDIGGGTHLSPLRTMGAAYQVAQLKGFPVDGATLLWHHTAGAAAALGLPEPQGHLAPGEPADAVVLDAHTSPLFRHRAAACRDLGELLFFLMTSGDDRQVAETWAAGRQIWARPPVAG